MSRIHALAAIAADLYESHKAEIDALPTCGPRGGRNAQTIAGWETSFGMVGRACKMAGVPTLPWWDGPNRTPTIAIPSIIRAEMDTEYMRIYRPFETLKGPQKFCVLAPHSDTLRNMIKSRGGLLVDFVINSDYAVLGSKSAAKAYKNVYPDYPGKIMTKKEMLALVKGEW